MIAGGDVVWLTAERGGEETRTLLLPIDPLPRPDGRVIARFELHNAHRLVRVIDEAPPPPSAVIVRGWPAAAACEARVLRARRVHTLLVYHDGSSDGESEPTEPRTYLAVDVAGCEGTAGFTNVAVADVRVRSLRRAALRERATPELIEAVRHVDDDVWGPRALRGDAFRMVDLPAHGVTVVVGNAAWLLRDGVVLSGAEPVTLIEAGPVVFFGVQTVSEGWLASLADFAPRHAPVECEVIDDSGSAMNVRAGPRGSATVVTALPAGTRVIADDASGSWLHVASRPPGWAHQRGLRCPRPEPLPGR